MYQESLVLPPHLQKMIFEMELRGYSQYTKDHYLGHIRLLEKHTNKSAPQITPDELKKYLHERIQALSSNRGIIKLYLLTQLTVVQIATDHRWLLRSLQQLQRLPAYYHQPSPIP